MNRPLDKGKLEVLSLDECWDRLASEPVGRVAFVADGEVTILPVNHAVAGRSILFRTAHGARLPQSALDRVVAFEVDGYDPGERTGWSVLVRGQADEVSAAEISIDLDELGFSPWSDEAGRDQWIRVRADEISGRRIPDLGS